MGRSVGGEAIGAAASMEANCDCDSGHFMGGRSRRARTSCLNVWSAKAGCNEHEERYLIVTCMVITDVPEPFCPLPVAVMAKASLPLYLAFAVYW